VSAHRRVVALVGGGLVLFLSSVGTASPASAHGALSSPVSRAAACGTEGGASARSAACTAAAAASGRQVFSNWDELRVSGVDGRDRAVIPDGKLCSGGRSDFRGLDLPRADWPATSLVAGASFRFRYRATIGHAGTFRLYVTTDAYRPTAPLTWAQIERTPFLAVTDPPLTGGAYTLSGTLPRKSGRQLIYTIWQNSTSADTYYSCSDVIFRASAGTGGTGSGPATRAPATTPKRAPAAPASAPRSTPASAPGSAPGSSRGGPSPSGPAAPGAAGSTPQGEPVAVPAFHTASWDSRDPTRLVLTATGAAVVLAAAAMLVAVRRRAVRRR
jgi:predicted carbohydrate-binding protein with CBM5 and CBM33 domain